MATTLREKIMNERLRIKRWYLSDVTLGRVQFGEFKCVCLELPWLDNRPDVSCIPEGVYLCRKIVSNKNGPCFEIVNVPSRSHVQGHIGNFTRDIEGCQVYGDGIRDIDNDGILDVTSSGLTFCRLMKLLPNEFYMEIS